VSVCESKREGCACVSRLSNNVNFSYDYTILKSSNICTESTITTTKQAKQERRGTFREAASRIDFTLPVLPVLSKRPETKSTRPRAPDRPSKQTSPLPRFPSWPNQQTASLQFQPSNHHHRHHPFHPGTIEGLSNCYLIGG